MTVAELIERLQECDPDAEVRIMSQENWPFENAISGIAVRQDFAGEDCECDRRVNEPHADGCPAAEDEEFEHGLHANDVFIVEGRQERYGSKRAWEVAD
ncbi:MAG: hypothetical protein LC118_05325 [Dehalococcoidia bacterium]|nr:hypothetical protein [Dehalococcoidia bacterium]